MSNPEEKLVYCQISWSGDFDGTLENVKAAAGHVDGMVVVHPPPMEVGNFSEKQIEDLLEAAKPSQMIVSITKQGSDSTATAIDVARNMGATWILVSDPDEHFSEAVFRNLKSKIIPSLKASGVTGGGFMCDEAFDRVEWTDDLDAMAQPSKAEPRQTTWVVKLVALNVPPSERKTGNLPYVYSYTHRKTALSVWRSVARRTFLGALSAGNTDKGPGLANELVRYAKELNCGSWPMFEKYVTTFHANTTHVVGQPFKEEEVVRTEAVGHDEDGTFPTEVVTVKKAEERWPDFNPLVDWCRRALASNEDGVRTTAKWILWYHRDLLEQPGMLERAKTQPPPPTPAPVQAAPAPQPEGIEDIMVSLPVESVVHITEEWITKLMLNSRTFREKFAPRLDVGSWIEGQLGKEFYKEFYEMKAAGKLDMMAFIMLLRKALPSYAESGTASQNTTTSTTANQGSTVGTVNIPNVVY